MSHHLLLYLDIMVHLAVVHLELEPHEARQYRRRACLRADGRDPLPGLGADDWETVARGVSNSFFLNTVPETSFEDLRDNVGSWQG